MNIFGKLGLYFHIFQARYLGRNKCRCNLCDKKFVRFLPFRDFTLKNDDFIAKLEIVGSNLQSFSCPYCFSTDRERNMVRFFSAYGVAAQYVTGKRILYIAPEREFRRLVASWSPAQVVEGDLFPKNGQTRVDLQDICFEQNYFDTIICNHVLEHVVDVDQCLREIRRVLKPSGALLAQTPYSAKLKTTLEIQEAWGDGEFCEVAHGQSDHLRVFGSDFSELVKSYGFSMPFTSSVTDVTRSDVGILCELGVNHKEPFLFFESK